MFYFIICSKVNNNMAEILMCYKCCVGIVLIYIYLFSYYRNFTDDVVSPLLVLVLLFYDL